MAKRVSNNAAAPYIGRREEFQGSNFYGELTPGGYRGSVGHMPTNRAERESLADADYVVWSYWTPIGWHIPGEGWVVPLISYSTSTAKHVGYVRQAAWGNFSPRHLADPWSLDLSRTSGDILNAIRNGYGVDRGTRRRSTLEAVVATGEAKWSEDGESIVPADDRHVRA